MSASDRAPHATSPGPPLSALEHERLVSMLAGMPESRRWQIAHMHAPLLCALGLGVSDSGYARAVERRFNDPADVRRRALALVEELDRDTRRERYVARRRKRWPGFRTS